LRESDRCCGRFSPVTDTAHKEATRLEESEGKRCSHIRHPNPSIWERSRLCKVVIGDIPGTGWGYGSTGNWFERPSLVNSRNQTSRASYLPCRNVGTRRRENHMRSAMVVLQDSLNLDDGWGLSGQLMGISKCTYACVRGARKEARKRAQRRFEGCMDRTVRYTWELIRPLDTRGIRQGGTLVCEKWFARRWPVQEEKGGGPRCPTPVGGGGGDTKCGILRKRTGGA